MLTENQQAVEKRTLRPGGVLEVHSIFDTIQGEGPFAGIPSTFIRLAGCNLCCRWCDTDYTRQRDVLKPREIMRKLSDLPQRRLVVVTGGEPFRQDLSGLVDAVTSSGRKIQIETNGTLPIGVLDTYYLLAVEHRQRILSIVCSPKTPKLSPGIWEYIDAVKYVVQHEHVDPADGLPMLSVGPQYGRPARPPKDWTGVVYVQPLDQYDAHANALNRKQAAASCMQFGYRLTVQMHKDLDLP